MKDALGKIDFDKVRSKLYSAVIADILDDLGFRYQAMTPDIRPVDSSSKLLGVAFTVRATDVYEITHDPYESELAAVDSLSERDVLVATVNGSTTCGFWGELLSTAAVSKGAEGAVVDGYTRDSSGILDMRFPVFARGCSPLDSKGRAEVVSWGDPIKCGGVEVHTGDVIFADRDGVVVIPQAHVNEVIPQAIEKVESEDGMRRALQDGMGVVEAYRQYRIL